MSNLNGLPKGWSACSLGDVLTIIRGVSYDKTQASKIDSHGMVPILRATNINQTLDFDDLVYVQQSCVSQEQYLQRGDIVIAASSGSRNVVGKAAQLKHQWPGAFGAFCMGLRVSKQTNSSYVSWFLQSHEYRRKVSDLAAGSNINNLRRNHIQSFPFRLAPLNEQHRIVAKIEELFSDLDAGVTALERVRANLKRYRAAVLKAAVEGKLTQEWRAKHPKTEPASKLLEGILADRRQKWEEDQLARFADADKTPPKGWRDRYVEPAGPETSGLPILPHGWCWASVDQLSIVVRGASPRPAGDPRFFGGHVPWITVGALTADESPYLREVSEGLTDAGRDASRYIQPDTLLLTNSGATLGVPKITLIGGCINDGSVALFHLDYPLKLYLFYFLKTQTRKLRAINQGAAQPNLNTAIVKAILVPLPPVVEQQQILAEIERRLSVFAENEAQVDTGLKRAARLRQSILKRAFEGKLVPQDPTDEPANKLLERIRQERAEANGSASPPTRPARAPRRKTADRTRGEKR